MVAPATSALEVVDGPVWSPTFYNWRGYGSQVIRRVWTTRPHLLGESLDEVLVRADAYFDGLAASIGGKVVPHEWVLVENDRANSLARVGIRGYELAAKVDVVRGRPMANDNNSFYSGELRRFSSSHSRINGWTIPDAARIRQFLAASTPRRVIPSPVLVDIDIIAAY